MNVKKLIVCALFVIVALAIYLNIGYALATAHSRIGEEKRVSQTSFERIITMDNSFGSIKKGRALNSVEFFSCVVLWPLIYIVLPAAYFTSYYVFTFTSYYVFTGGIAKALGLA